MGEQLIDFSPGDIIVVDNLKLHGLSRFDGESRYAVIVTFMPDLIGNPNACLCDYVLLSPFYCLREGTLPVLRYTDRLAAPAHQALEKLVNCWDYLADGPESQAGCKAYLMELLYHLARRYSRPDIVRSEYLEQKRLSDRLGQLFTYLEEKYAEKVSVSTAAALVAMSESQFMKFFRRATGTTFVTYLTRLRLNRAYRLLTETDTSVADVAYAVGFSDQSYFTKRFRETFGHTPREIRARVVGEGLSLGGGY